MILHKNKLGEFSSILDFINKEVKQKEFNESMEIFLNDLKDNYKHSESKKNDYQKYIKWDYEEQKDFLLPFLISYGWSDEELIQKILNNREKKYIMDLVNDYFLIYELEEDY